MHILGGSLFVIQKLPALVHQNCWKWRIRARCISHIKAIEMKYDVYIPTTYDRSLSPLVIMHGLFGLRHNWRSVAKLMSHETKRKVYCVDIRNHGDSPHTTEHGSIHLAVDLARFIKDKKLDKVCVLGHSMGGKGIMAFVLNFPNFIEKAIIVDISPITMPNDLELMMGILRAMLKAHAPRNASLRDGRRAVKAQLLAMAGINEATVNFILLGYTKTPSGEFKWKMNVPTMLNAFTSFQKEPHIQWGPFDGPVLFICGRKSPYMKPDEWPKVKALFPNGEIVWLNCGHLIHLEAPTQLIQQCRKFLAK